MTRHDAIAQAVMSVACVLIAWCLGYQAGAPDQPSCPTEDSCAVDYRDGAYHVEETTP